MEDVDELPSLTETVEKPKSEINDGLLINLVHSYPILWNTTRVDYKNEILKIQTWKNIARCLDVGCK